MSIRLLLTLESYFCNMNNPIRIKLGSVSNLSDARFAAASGVAFIGFNFNTGSALYLPPVKAKEIIDWISGPQMVAEFGNQDLVSIMELSTLLQVNIIEVENELEPNDLLSLGLPVIKKIDIANSSPDDLLELLNRYKDSVDAFHLWSSDQSISLDDALLKQLCSSFQIVWGLPLQKENALSVCLNFNPYAINLTGAEEEKPGLKDFDELSGIVEVLIPQT